MAALPIDVMWKVYGSILNHWTNPKTLWCTCWCLCAPDLWVVPVLCTNNVYLYVLFIWPMRQIRMRSVDDAYKLPSASRALVLQIIWLSVTSLWTIHTVPQWYYTCGIWLLIILKQCNEVSIGLTLVHTLYRWPTVSRMVSARTNRLPSEYDTLSIVNCGLMVTIQNFGFQNLENENCPRDWQTD